MVTTIVIPRDPMAAPRIQELASLGDFQEVVGGWLEPFEVEALGITIWSNEAACRERAGINARATALCLHYMMPGQAPLFMLGDVVIAASDAQQGGADLPDYLLVGLSAPLDFIVQITRYGEESWNDTVLRFDNVYDAALWCHLMERSYRPGSASFRIVARVPAHEDDLITEGQLW